MILILPPSETKRDGGMAESRFDHGLLGHPELRRSRRTALAAVRSLGRNRAAMTSALRLGPTQQAEVDRNRSLSTSAVMPAIERYTGILYDEIAVSSLPTSARLFAGERVIIHSALFGLLRADDPIPAYRLSHDSRLPGLRLAAHWRDGISRALDAYPGLVIDLRSEAYVALGPVPPGPGRFLLRVVSDAEDGTVRAISHANKLSKGRLIRSLLLAGLEHPDVESLILWSEQEGIRLRVRTPGELELVGY